MALEPLTVWQATYADEVVPTQDPVTGALNLANWAAARVNGNLNLAGVGGPGMIFTFNSAAWAAALQLLPPTPLAEIGATNFANSWSTAMAASLAITQPGTSVTPTPLPPTTFSVVNATIIDPTGITAGNLKLIELKDAEPSSNPLEVPLVEFLRDAFLLLTITTSGLDSVPTPAGPNPLTDPLRAVI